MAGWTNRGKYRALYSMFSSGTYSFRLIRSTSTTPSVTINTIADLTEVATANGYIVGGVALAGGTADFVITEDDANNRGAVTIRDINILATGGTIPATGYFRWAVLCDASTNVLAYWDLGKNYSIADTKTGTFTGFEIRATE